MKTILLFILSVFLLIGCKDEPSSKNSKSSTVSKKGKKSSAKKKTAKGRSSTGTTAKASYSSLEEEILFQVNKYRRSKGLSALQMNPVIATEAEKHSSNMATGRSGFGHAGFSSRINRISNKLGSVSNSGENVALGFITAKEVLHGWLQSPGHKKNIEGRFKLTGIGVAKDRSGTLYFTQVFVTK